MTTALHLTTAPTATTTDTGSALLALPQWQGLTDEAALDWMAAGFTATSYLVWFEAGFGADVAADWAGLNFTPDEATAWRADGWTASEAAELDDSGITREEAADWIGADPNVSNLIRCIRAGLEPMDAADDTPRRRANWDEDDWF